MFYSETVEDALMIEEKEEMMCLLSYLGVYDVLLELSSCLYICNHVGTSSISVVGQSLEKYPTPLLLLGYENSFPLCCRAINKATLAFRMMDCLSYNDAKIFGSCSVTMEYLFASHASVESLYALLSLIIKIFCLFAWSSDWKSLEVLSDWHKNFFEAIRAYLARHLNPLTRHTACPCCCSNLLRFRNRGPSIVGSAKWRSFPVWQSILNANNARSFGSFTIYTCVDISVDIVHEAVHSVLSSTDDFERCATHMRLWAAIVVHGNSPSLTSCWCDREYSKYSSHPKYNSVSIATLKTLVKTKYTNAFKKPWSCQWFNDWSRRLCSSPRKNS